MIDWKNRGVEKWNWIKKHWKTIDHPHRRQIIQELKNLKWNSLLEIGCGCGVNLYYIKQEFKNKLLFGIDINEASICYGRKKLTDVTLIQGAIENIKINYRFDVILLDAVLLYVSDKNIKNVIKKIKQATDNIIMCEWYDESELGKIIDDHWARNYPKILKNWDVKVKKVDWPSDKKWQKNGRLFIVKKRKRND